MKKKGLIISTVVMVVVLIASLTTATYAWFTASDVTSIEGFDVSVVSSNAVDIGLKENNTHVAPSNVTRDMFVSGTCEYGSQTAGTIGGGKWSGNKGLSSTVEHGIIWGSQAKAVGVSTTAFAAATPDTTQFWGVAGGQTVVASTVKQNEDGQTVFAEDKSEAKANVTGCDYAYIFLGAAPTKKLSTSELIILIDGSQSTGSIVGILSAIHVAYRVTKSNDTAAKTEWTDVDVFGADKLETTEKVEGIHYGDVLSEVQCNLTPEEKNTYASTYGTGAVAPENSAYALRIQDLSIEKGKIDQIELVIYIAGHDSDCIDQAKGASGSIKIFFHTTEA